MQPGLAMLARLAGEIGATDCERLDDDALLSQPVNALSSLVYVVAAAWVVHWARREARVATADAIVFALGLGLVGVGSVDFHGPQTPAARFVHDASIVILVAWMASFDLRSCTGTTRTRSNVAVAVVAVVAAAVLGAAPDSGIAMAAAAGLAFVGAEVAVFRRGFRHWHEPDGYDRVGSYTVSVLLVGLALALNLLGRTDAPLCDPDGWFQGHGAWHALSAIAFAAWARGALVVSGTARTVRS